MKNTSNDLTKGSISNTIIKLALPIMGSSFIEMAYNLIDIIWIGRLGSKEIAAIGTAGFYLWIMTAILVLSRVGAEVLIPNAIGRKDEGERVAYIKNSMYLALMIILPYSFFVFVFRNSLIGFFNLDSEEVVSLAIAYLARISIFMIFPAINLMFTAIYNAHGNSKVPFIFNGIGIMTNIVLDPIFIFGLGLPRAFGVNGAAIATIISHILVIILFIFSMRKHGEIFENVNFLDRPNFLYIRNISEKGIGPALQSTFFASISMVLARIMGSFGDAAIAAQRVSGQIESISWRVAAGFGTALTAFMGQNYGAGKIKRALDGYKNATSYTVLLALFTSIIFIFFPEPICRLFFFEEDALAIAISCLRIMGYSQIFMNLEIISTAAYNGFGRTNIPAIAAITFNFSRIPMAYLLSGLMGIDGVWWTITISSILKGLTVGGTFIYIYFLKDTLVKKI